MKKMFASIGMVVSLLLGGAVAASPAQAELVPVVQAAMPVMPTDPRHPPKWYEDMMKANGTEQRVLAQADAADKKVAANNKGRGPKAPVPPSLAKRASCGSPSVCYDYNSFTQVLTADPADSTSITMMIGKPYVDNSVLAGAHSLGEGAVQSADSKDIVEFGWTVDKTQRADGNPILWAGHWINGVWKGYNLAWVDVTTNPVNLGAGLPKPVAKSFNIAQTSTAFWVMYDGQWVAYVPKSRWTPGGVVRPFNAAVADFHVVQWFNESASHETETCNDLGTGTIYNAGGTPTPPVTTFDTYALGGTTIAPNLTVSSTNPGTAAWGAQQLTSTSGTTGGPGYNPAGTAVGTTAAC